MGITYKQLAELQYPTSIHKAFHGGVYGCPHKYGYKPIECDEEPNDEKCEACWNTEVPYPVYAIAKHDGNIPGTLYKFKKGDEFPIYNIKHIDGIENQSIGIIYMAARYIVYAKDFDIYVDYSGRINSNTIETKTKESNKKENETMKYKVGDRVRIKTWEKMAQEFGVDDDGDIMTGENLYVLKKMKEYCGNIYTICDIQNNRYSLEGIYGYIFSDSMIEQKELTKDDLKTGMIIEYRDKTRGIIIGDTIVEPDTFLSMSNLTDNLKCSDSHYPNNDIMKVYEGREGNSFGNMLSYPGKLIWQRYETREISMDEAMKIIAEHIGTKDFKITDHKSE